MPDSIQYDPNRFEEVAPPTTAASPEDIRGQRVKAILDDYEKNGMQKARDAVTSVGASFYPEGTANPLAWLGEKLGFSKIPDKLMQSAVGIKKYIPGVGTELMDQGVYGTRGMMGKQIATLYPKAEAKIQELAAATPGKVASSQIAQPIEQAALEHLIPGTNIPISGGEDAYAVKNAVAGAIKNAPEYDAPGLLKLKRAGDAEAYNQSGLVGNTYKAAAYKQQADAARAALSDLSGGEMPKALAKERALVLANKGLTKPESSTLLSLKDFIGGEIGEHYDGMPGAVAGAAISHAAASPLGKSTAAYALRGTGQAVSQAPARFATLKALDAGGVSSQPSAAQLQKAVQFDPNRFEVLDQ